jgi:SAM-dependent methyltransferase
MAAAAGHWLDPRPRSIAGVLRNRVGRGVKVARVGEGEVDIEALVDELRAEADALRASVAAVPPPPPVEPLPSVADPEAIDRLLALADPRDVELSSHRGRLAPTALAVKRLLQRLLTPVWDRQMLFNQRLAVWLGEVESELDDTLATLARRIAALESSLPDLIASEGISPVDVEDLEAEVRGVHPAAERRRYLAYFPDAAAGPVLEIGCGRGRFLAMLRDAGIPGLGFDPDAHLVAEARALGLDASAGDPVAALAERAPASLGGVVCFRFLERLPLAKVVRALRLAREKLRPGGCLVVEARNLGSLIVHTRGWALDPALRQPLHPLTLRFLVAEVGFARPEIVYSGEVEPGAALEGAGDETATARNAARLNALLFAPQEYAVVARS